MNQAIRLLDRDVVNIGEAGPAVDLGGFAKVRAQIRVHTAGSDGTIELQHAAVDEDLAFQRIGDQRSRAVDSRVLPRFWSRQPRAMVRKIMAASSS